MHRMAVALTTSIAGVGAPALVATGHILATSGTAGASDYVTSIGGVSAAAALVYIVKQMVDGKLVARDPARIEVQQSEQNRQLLELAAASHEREDRLRNLYDAAIGGKS